jgi:signal recognition particle subunit SEC65
MSTNQFIQYGHAQKPFEQLNAEELAEVNKRLDLKIRERAWAVGSPVYYGVNGLVIAEYHDGRKMIIEEVNGQMVETKEYNG